MAKLSILGAQRIKALTEMLKEQEAAAVAEINKQKMTRQQAEDIVNTELGIKEYFDEIKALENRIEELTDLIQPKTGYYYSISRGTRYGTDWKKYSDRVEKLQNGNFQEKIQAVRAEFKRKEQQLWLCETLEEAKAIVGI